MELFKKVISYLPGFQSRKPSKIVVASIFYLVTLISMFQGMGNFVYGGSIFLSMLLIGYIRTRDFSSIKVIRYFLYAIIFTVITGLSYSVAANIDPGFSKNQSSPPAITSNPKPSQPAPIKTLPKSTTINQTEPKVNSTQSQTLNKSTPITSGTNTQRSSDKKEITVYRTKTGSKYHLSGCQYLRKSKISISLPDAQTMGLSPCSVCDPPGGQVESSNNSYPTTPQYSSPKYNSEPSESKQREYTVYVTRTGSKYHLDGCRYLSRSQIPMSLSEAKSSGYDPCSVCGPPY